MSSRIFPGAGRPSHIISLSVLAYAVQDVLQDGLGHGVTAWLSGAHHLTLSTVALSSDVETRWIAAISRSIPWITLGAIATLLFILVLGHGVTWAR